MVHELTMDSLTESLEWADVVVIGPGLGQQEWGKSTAKVENFRKPMLWDADALNLLAINPDKRHNRVITPHPGEAARLLGCSVAEIESDRLHCAKRLVQRYGGVAVLKGAGTVVAAHPDALGIIDAGNAGMASGGMGDVLSGIIGALLGQNCRRMMPPVRAVSRTVLQLTYWRRVLERAGCWQPISFHATAYC